MPETEPVYKEPEWYDVDRLVSAWYVKDEYGGWVIDLGDGTCRFANDPMLGEDGPNWGDRVRLIKRGNNRPVVDYSEILERYDPEVDLIKEKHA